MDNAIIKNSFNGIILAGGKSERFGEDKRFAKLFGLTLLEITINKLKQLCDFVVIASGKEHLSFEGGVSVTDKYDNIGPIAGLAAGLNEIRTNYAIVLPCDMPLFPVDILRFFILKISLDTKVIVSKINNVIQPLVGIYSKLIYPELISFIESGGDSLKSFIINMNKGVVFVGESELEVFGNVHLFYRNVNTKEDLNIILSLLNDNIH
jgi:molybdopterin-guanine dinucleotide biosynthesis protein A